ncbi:MAG: CBS domain-containing protein [Planctomycetota bacterium]|jgi:CBS domain-containing protein
MGNTDTTASDNTDLRTFMQAVLEDIQALETMIERGMIERDVRRIGAEQELFLVDDSWHAVAKQSEVLARLKGNYTRELAAFNIEANLSPQPLTGKCLSDMQEELDVLIRDARGAAQAEDARILMCGILPTLHQSDLSLKNMAESERYHRLNRVMVEMRGGHFETLIKGLDELRVVHDNVMMEACNTSFQIHFQVHDDEFANLYNLAQLVTGPVMAAAVNSPVLLQHRLWHESRVALFAQSLDVRNASQLARNQRQRVTFGERWVKDGVIEIFREDVARFRLLLGADKISSSFETLENGGIPTLDALRMHNGTVYRWNRPCYGISDGKPHLRIENRVLPAGPTPEDEIANAAFFFGLMIAYGEELDDVRRIMEFDDAKGNFMAAARYGLSAEMRWFNGRRVSARDLILSDLLPRAREGLAFKNIDSSDIDKYLGLIEERVSSGRTGAQWALDSLASMGDKGTQDERHRALASATYARQATGLPGHRWALADLDDTTDWRHSFKTVAQIMSRDVFTVHPEDVIDLAVSLMDWEHIRYVPVEDGDGKLVGLLSQRMLMRLVARRHGKRASDAPLAVREVMAKDPVTISPGDTTLAAIEKMNGMKIGCLPVVENGRLVGIVTEHDFVDAAARLLRQTLESPKGGGI